MRQFISFFQKVFFVALLISGSTLLAATTDFIVVEGAYVRGLPPSVKNTSAYMTIKNTSNQDIELIGAKTNIADSVMIHRTENTNGVMSMEHVMSHTIPAHGEFQLKSGATHLMIMGLKAPLDPSSNVDITLLFSEGLELTVTMPVRSVLDE